MTIYLVCGFAVHFANHIPVLYWIRCGITVNIDFHKLGSEEFAFDLADRLPSNYWKKALFSAEAHTHIAAHDDIPEGFWFHKINKK